MAGIARLIERMQKNPAGVRFTDLVRICDHYFGKSRQKGTSHRVYGTPWQRDPRISIQNRKGMARPYQVRQVLKAIERLNDERGSRE